MLLRCFILWRMIWSSKSLHSFAVVDDEVSASSCAAESLMSSGTLTLSSLGSWSLNNKELAGTAWTLAHKSIKNNPMAVNASPNEALLQALATAPLALVQQIFLYWLYVAVQGGEVKNVVMKAPQWTTGSCQRGAELCVSELETFNFLFFWLIRGKIYKRESVSKQCDVSHSLPPRLLYFSRTL